MCCTIVGVSSNVLYYRRVNSNVFQNTLFLVFQTANSGKNRRYDEVRGPSCVSLQQCAGFRPEKNNNCCEEYFWSYLHFVQCDTLLFCVALITIVL
jgi:hypothetical protein